VAGGRGLALTQVGITGLTPEGEPSLAELSAVTEFVRANNLSTIYSEALVSPNIAETVARETGFGLAELVALDEDRFQRSPVPGDAKGAQLRHSPTGRTTRPTGRTTTRASGAARFGEADGLEVLRVTGPAPLRAD